MLQAADLAGVLAAAVHEVLDGHLGQRRPLRRRRLSTAATGSPQPKKALTKSAMLARPILESSTRAPRGRSPPRPARPPRRARRCARKSQHLLAAGRVRRPSISVYFRRSARSVSHQKYLAILSFFAGKGPGHPGAAARPNTPLFSAFCRSGNARQQSGFFRISARAARPARRRIVSICQHVARDHGRRQALPWSARRGKLRFFHRREEGSGPSLATPRVRRGARKTPVFS